MSLFADYLQPLTDWVYANPNWAFLFTFLISFSESLAIIGSIVPGSLTMTAIGILAGSGVMRIDLTLFAAILGAIAGDGASYALGYTFRHRLVALWPFSRYPNLLTYGKDYFSRHGGKSVLIGRFVGPLRSIIPVIAGMMHMNHWHFLTANIISAIGWSLLYVGPGILIGAASSELSAESASRLFVLILVSLAAIWLFGLGLKWLFIRINRVLAQSCHQFWGWSKDHGRMSYLLRYVTPEYEKNHYPTVAVLFLTILSFIATLLITLLANTGKITTLNQYIFFFLQSLRTETFDLCFITLRLLINPLVIASYAAVVGFFALYHRDWRFVRYWLSLCISTMIGTLILSTWLSQPQSISTQLHCHSCYPATPLSMATALFGFIILYANHHYPRLIAFSVRLIGLALLLLAGTASAYLGIHQFSHLLTAFGIGLTLCFGHWLLYRRALSPPPLPPSGLALGALTLFFTSSIAYYLQFDTLVEQYRPVITQYQITHHAWWHQKKPLLPLYTTNRIGKRTGLFNLQYVGSVELLERALEQYGWKKKSGALLYTILARISGESTEEDLPIMSELYLNHKPLLVMIYNPKNAEPVLILRLWKSNYRLKNTQQPIWIGSVHQQRFLHKRHNKITDHQRQSELETFKYMLPALYQFKLNRMGLENKQLFQVPLNLSPTILFIKAPKNNSPTTNPNNKTLRSNKQHSKIENSGAKSREDLQ